MELESDDLKALYGNRFNAESEQRQDIWEVLCSDFFQKWVPADATVLDLAAGHCEFINNIKAGRKIAVDLNPDVKVRAAEGVETHVLRSDKMTDIPDHSVDRVFISNFFEHISREVITATLLEVRRVLKPGGQLLLLQPNVRFCGKDYWQFFDHITPVDDRAMEEAFAQTGYRVVKSIPRFLPYTTKSRLPSGPALVRLYLKVPLAWKVLGAQAFMVATPA
ncbi:MAG TPA: class I SAM-dependent methyltransferase [Jatrophihabitans sp.]|nr:class I SAM-dependent methyltransferase [Jatrophihabitans sp.]